MEWRGLLSLSGFWDIEGNIYIDENLFNLSPPSMNNFGPAVQLQALYNIGEGLSSSSDSAADASSLHHP